MSAIDLQMHLRELEAERALTRFDPDGDSWVTDLDYEIEAIREAYVAAAVTEIATLRAELSGPQWG
jgi:hypothetical protein